MPRRPHSAIWPLLLVVSVAFGVFAASSFAVSGVSAGTAELLQDDVIRLESVKTSGSVKVDHRRGEKAYRLKFRATLEMGENRGDAALQDQHAMPDVVIHQSIRYPLLALDDQIEFVGPVGLPFDSHELALGIVLAGACFEDGDFVFDHKADVRCVGAQLTLGDVAFEVGDLLTAVRGRVWRTGRDGATVKMKFDATFADPGYPFPITSLGEGSETTVRFGPFGGTSHVQRVSFSG